jgi:hypothetical protein
MDSGGARRQSMREFPAMVLPGDEHEGSFDCG